MQLRRRLRLFSFFPYLFFIFLSLFSLSFMSSLSYLKSDTAVAGHEQSSSSLALSRDRRRNCAKALLDQATYKHRSFGFVTFLEREDADAAMDNMDAPSYTTIVLKIIVDCMALHFVVPFFPSIIPEPAIFFCFGED